MSANSDVGQELERARRELAECRERLADANNDNMRFSQALEEAHNRYLELNVRYEEANLMRSRDAERELDALLRTKTFRWARVPRKLWSTFVK